jgi:hypothetical protein
MVAYVTDTNAAIYVCGAVLLVCVPKSGRPDESGNPPLHSSKGVVQQQTPTRAQITGRFPQRDGFWFFLYYCQHACFTAGNNTPSPQNPTPSHTAEHPHPHPHAC